MPLPALLLERLKKRKIIKETTVGVALNDPIQERDSSVESRYQDQHNHLNLENEEEQEEIIAEDYSDDESNSDDHDEAHDKNSTLTSNPIDNLNEDEKPASASSEINISVVEKVAVGDQMCATHENVEDKTDFNLGDNSVLGCPNKYNIFHDCSQYCIENYGHLENQQPTLEQRKQLALILKTYPISNEWSVVYDPGVKTFYFWNIISNLVSWLPPAMNGFLSMPADQIRKRMKELEHEHEV